MNPEFRSAAFILSGWAIGIWVGWSLNSCGPAAKATTSSDMGCERIAYGGVGNGYRCENAEAVCMLADNTTAISCWRKP